MALSQHIVIIGAGVLGLTTAVLLQERQPIVRITIVAAEVPLTPPFTEAPRPSVDYASMWAGAHFRPTPGQSGQLLVEQKMALHTSSVMRRLALSNPESGVQSVKGLEIMEYIPDDKVHFKEGDVYACTEGDHFRLLRRDEIPASGKWGCEYDTWIVNVHVYCRWLLTKFTAHGGNLVQSRLEKLEDAFDFFPAGIKSPLLINCSGRNFDTDPKVNVIRGQTVLVKNTFHKTATRHNQDGSWCFLIPRPLGGGTIIGGTKQLGDWGTDVRPEETKSILAAAVKYWPQFATQVEDLEVAAINVGRRPWRDGGLRIESEKLDNGRRVVHGYGAGARGYELSWGAAERIVLLALKELGSFTKSKEHLEKL